MQNPSLESALLQSLPVQNRSLLVAVSGGVDSVVLLHLLQQQAEKLALSMQVAHLNHQLRPESGSDADFVAAKCNELGLRCHIESCNVALLAEQQKMSLEMAGRQARRDFLHRIRVKIGADLIVLAHHRNDQVETFLLRLIRGSGVSGLAAMDELQGVLWRPLLHCSRQQILGYACQHELDWVEDSSNSDPVFLRNKLRSDIVPQLRQINPQFDRRLGNLITQVTQEEDYWQDEVAETLPKIVIASDDGLRLARQPLLELHPALRSRVLRGALRQVRGNLQRIEAVHLQAIEALLQQQRSQAQLDLPTCWVARRYQQLWLRREEPVAALPFDLSVPVPGEVELPDGRVLRLTLSSEQHGESTNVVEFSAAKLGANLQVRSWLPGDRFVPQGTAGRKRLKRYFSDNMVELEQRQQVPLLVANGEIIWLVGMRRSNLCAADLDGGAVLRVELS